MRGLGQCCYDSDQQQKNYTSSIFIWVSNVFNPSSSSPPSLQTSRVFGLVCGLLWEGFRVVDVRSKMTCFKPLCWKVRGLGWRLVACIKPALTSQLKAFHHVIETSVKEALDWLARSSCQCTAISDGHTTSNTTVKMSLYSVFEIPIFSVKGKTTRWNLGKMMIDMLCVLNRGDAEKTFSKSQQGWRLDKGEGSKVTG